MCSDIARAGHTIPLAQPRSTRGTVWTCTGSITRFVWAGDQILWELRAPGNDGANLEATTGSGNAYGQVSYTHAGGMHRPLVITKNGVSVVPHQNWRGMFALGTNPTGGRDVPDIDWPGFHTTPWHGKTRVVENWFGSLSTGMRDASGQMYMRNRYYDPATGQFTQPDPMGLAGGLNSYGFAAGDPVTYSDPYGLRVTFENAASERLWGELQRMALRASNSRDARTREAGSLLTLMMTSVDEKLSRYHISASDFGSTLNKYGGAATGAWRGGTVDMSSGRFTPNVYTRMDDNHTRDTHHVPNVLVRAHEMGHAWGLMNNLPAIKPAHWAENAVRAILGCQNWRTTEEEVPTCP